MRKEQVRLWKLRSVEETGRSEGGELFGYVGGVLLDGEGAHARATSLSL